MKPGLRQHYLELLRQQPSKKRAANSKRIARQVFGLSAYQTAQTIFSYVSLPEEVGTSAIIRQALIDGKQACVPKLLHDRIVPVLLEDPETELGRGHFNIPEPVDHDGKMLKPKEIDLALIPGLAFDQTGGRLGRGRGHFDRFLPQLPDGTITCGLAFGFQIADKLPTETHDHPVSCLISEQQSYQF